MGAIQRFKEAIRELQLDEKVTLEIMTGYETISDSAKKEPRAVVSSALASSSKETCHFIYEIV